MENHVRFVFYDNKVQKGPKIQRNVERKKGFKRALASCASYSSFRANQFARLRTVIVYKHRIRRMTKKVYSTRYSQVVTQPSTNLALPNLTSGIGREPVFYRWYGRRQKILAHFLVICTPVSLLLLSFKMRGRANIEFIYKLHF